MIACCFTGHRDISLVERRQISSKLKETICDLVKTKGVTAFRCGGALGFDTIAALYVIELKNEYPEIKLIIDIPHRNQASMWSELDQHTYDYILNHADSINVISENYYKGCMQKRNRHMVDNSDYVVAYVKRAKGGSYYTACYAESLDKNVLYI